MALNSSCPPSVGQCNEWFTFVGYNVVQTTVSSIGIICNTLIIVVFTRNSLRGASFTFMLGLAIVDLIVCTLSLPLGLFRCLKTTVPWKNLMRNIYTIYILVPISNSFCACSVWTTLAMSIERYVSIKDRSGNRSKRFTSSHASVTIFSLLVMAQALHVPYFFHRYIDPRDPKRLIVSDFGKTEGFRVYLWIRMTLMKFIPIVSVAIVNGLLIKVVVTATKRQNQLVFPHTHQVNFVSSRT